MTASCCPGLAVARGRRSANICSPRRLQPGCVQHMLVADGVFHASGAFTVAPVPDGKQIAALFRNKVLKMLLAKGRITPDNITLMDNWRRGSAHGIGRCARMPGPARDRLPANGSGLYTVQALWSMARDSEDVTVVVCTNPRYRILQNELARAGIAQTGPQALALTDLTRPAIDWVGLAKGFGVPACSVGTDSELAGALHRAFTERGPGLVEAVLA